MNQQQNSILTITGAPFSNNKLAQTPYNFEFPNINKLGPSINLYMEPKGDQSTILQSPYLPPQPLSRYTNQRVVVPQQSLTSKKSISASPNQAFRISKKNTPSRVTAIKQQVNDSPFLPFESQVMGSFMMGKYPKSTNAFNPKLNKILINTQNPKHIASQLASLYLAQNTHGNDLVMSNSMVLIARTMKINEDKRDKNPKVIDLKETPFRKENQNYKYFLGGGNNSELVRRVMELRPEWEETTDYRSQDVNFKWQQGNKGYKYERLIINNNYRQLVNHFEHHREISNKEFLLKNLTYYCEQIKINVFEFVPPTFILDFNDDQIDVQLTQFLKFFENSAPASRGYPPELQIRRFSEIKRNLKVLLCQNEKKQTRNYCKPRITKNMQSENDSYLWLLKPTFLNRGRGIHVFNDLEALTKLVSEYQDGTEEKNFEQDSKRQTYEPPQNSKAQLQKFMKEIIGQMKTISELKSSRKVCGIIKSDTFVVQKYIEKPFLINQRKFDIRVWVLVTHDMDCYFFKEGYIRTSSENFKTDDIDNYFIHLTNNAIQKYASNYGQFENGNQLSFDDFQNYLDAHKYNHNFKIKTISRIKELIWISLCSVRKKLNHEDRKFCMEIFGYDFIIDQDFNVWLIEVNTNPCIEESSPLLQMLLPRMLDDAFMITIDQLFPQSKLESKKMKGVIEEFYQGHKSNTNKEDDSESLKYVSNFDVNNYSKYENMWYKKMFQSIQREHLGNLIEHKKMNAQRQ